MSTDTQEQTETESDEIYSCDIKQGTCKVQYDKSWRPVG